MQKLKVKQNILLFWFSFQQSCLQWKKELFILLALKKSLYCVPYFLWRTITDPYLSHTFDYFRSHFFKHEYFVYFTCLGMWGFLAFVYVVNTHFILYDDSHLSLTHVWNMPEFGETYSSSVKGKEIRGLIRGQLDNKASHLDIQRWNS